jgi:hypothetical protein
VEVARSWVSFNSQVSFGETRSPAVDIPDCTAPDQFTTINDSLTIERSLIVEHIEVVVSECCSAEVL